MMDNINLLTSSTFLHLGKANKFALLSVYETSSAFDALSACSTLCLLGASASPSAPLSKATGFLHIQNRKK